MKKNTLSLFVTFYTYQAVFSGLQNFILFKYILSVYLPRDIETKCQI